MPGNKRKRIVQYAAIAAATSVFLLIIPVIMTGISGGEYIVTYKNDSSVRVKKLFICGNTVICMKETRDAAGNNPMADSAEVKYSLSILPLSSIKRIELAEGEDAPEAPAGRVEPVYLGSYKIRLQGYTGRLRLHQGEDKVTGTVQFPDWGNGKVEYLRGVSIGGGRIRFTRSANTDAEIRRLGANSYFTQKFSGTYSNSGKNISGFLINHRNEKHQWDAEKER